MPSFKKSLIVELFHGNYLKLAAILWHFPVMQWFQSVQVFKTLKKKKTYSRCCMFLVTHSHRAISFYLSIITLMLLLWTGVKPRSSFKKLLSLVYMIVRIVPIAPVVSKSFETIGTTVKSRRGSLGPPVPVPSPSPGAD